MDNEKRIKELLKTIRKDVISALEKDGYNCVENGELKHKTYKCNLGIEAKYIDYIDNMNISEYLKA